MQETERSRKESSAILSFRPSEGIQLPAEPRGKQRDARLIKFPCRSERDGQQMYGQGSNRCPDIPSLEDVAITISVIEGPSKGSVYELSKLCITVGRIGGGADFELAEPEASEVQCILAARQNGVRLYHGISMNGTYVDDRRISTVELTHLDTFRVGSSLLLIGILPKRHADIG